MKRFETTTLHQDLKRNDEYMVSSKNSINFRYKLLSLLKLVLESAASVDFDRNLTDS